MRVINLYGWNLNWFCNDSKAGLETLYFIIFLRNVKRVFFLTQMFDSKKERSTCEEEIHNSVSNYGSLKC